MEERLHVVQIQEYWTVIEVYEAVTSRTQLVAVNRPTDHKI